MNKFNITNKLISFNKHNSLIKIPQIIKDLKIKKYPYWRIDVLFSDLKSNKVKIINNAGWHFNNLLTAEKLYNKLIKAYKIRYLNSEDRIHNKSIYNTLIKHLFNFLLTKN